MKLPTLEQRDELTQLLLTFHNVFTLITRNKSLDTGNSLPIKQYDR